MKLPRRQISASGSGRCRAAGRLAHRGGAEPIRRGRCASSSALPPGGADRHHRAPDRAMAVGAARPAIRHREPAGRRQQYRHRGGRACASGRLYAAAGRSDQRDQRDTLRQAQFQFHPRHRAGRGHHSRASTSWRSIHRFRPRRFPSSSPMPRPIRARSIWRRAATGPRRMCPASCSR